MFARRLLQNGGLLIASLFFWTAGFGAESCYGYQVINPPQLGPFSTRLEACHQWHDAILANGLNGAYSPSSLSSNGYVLQSNETICHTRIYLTQYGEGPGQNGTVNPVAMECPTDEDDPACAPVKGVATNFVASDVAATEVNGACKNNCQLQHLGIASTVSAGGGIGGIVYMEYTGKSCTVEAEPVTEGKCVSSSGSVMCSQEPAKSCGTFNGDQVCVDTVSTQSPCALYDSGGVACVSTAGSPPAPDNGTASQPATPTGTVSNESVTVNYFNSTVVNNSSTSVVTNTTGTNVGKTGGSSSSASSGGDDEENSASGGQTCGTAPTCAGDAIQCAILFQEWKQRCVDESDIPSAQDLGLTNEDGSPLRLPGSGEGEGEVDVSESIDSSGFFGGAECLADEEIDLGEWGSFVIAYSEFCWAFQVIGLCVVACAWISAAKIVVGANEGA